MSYFYQKLTGRLVLKSKTFVPREKRAGVVLGGMEDPEKSGNPGTSLFPVATRLVWQTDIVAEGDLWLCCDNQRNGQMARGLCFGVFEGGLAFHGAY